MEHLKWGSTLCGHKIEPGGWGDGLIDLDGKWGHAPDIVRDGEPTWDTSDFSRYPELRRQWTRRETAPIYPPRGWNGLSEREIFLAVRSPASYNIVVGKGRGWYVVVHDDGQIAVNVKSTAPIPVQIQALQNAQVLSKRLK